VNAPVEGREERQPEFNKDAESRPSPTPCCAIMKFRSLKIEAPRWGKNEGKLIAEIEIDGEKSKTTMQLPDEVAEKILHLAKQAIIDGVEKAANDFIFEITTSIPETLLIGQNA
jgi:hypothetical protein